MTGQGRRGKKEGAQAGLGKSRLRTPLILALLGGVGLIVVLLAVWIGEKPGTEAPVTSGGDQSSNPQAASAHKKRDFPSLVGRWIRVDGGYVIEVKGIETKSKMDAAYFNPRPIHVSVAEASGTKTGTKVYIELQDVGYPGSNYTLDYDPVKDVLTGYYYQAVQKQNFDVLFVRAR